MESDQEDQVIELSDDDDFQDPPPTSRLSLVHALMTVVEHQCRETRGRLLLILLRLVKQKGGRDRVPEALALAIYSVIAGLYEFLQYQGYTVGDLGNFRSCHLDRQYHLINL
jgi:hypothetical protein